MASDHRSKLLAEMHLQLFPLFLLAIRKLFLRSWIRGGRIGGSVVGRLWNDLDITLHPKSAENTLEKPANLELDFFDLDFLCLFYLCLFYLYLSYLHLFYLHLFYLHFLCLDFLCGNLFYLDDFYPDLLGRCRITRDWRLSVHARRCHGDQGEERQSSKRAAWERYLQASHGAAPSIG